MDTTNSAGNEATEPVVQNLGAETPQIGNILKDQINKDRVAATKKKVKSEQKDKRFGVKDMKSKTMINKSKRRRCLGIRNIVNMPDVELAEMDMEEFLARAKALEDRVKAADKRNEKVQAELYARLQNFEQAHRMYAEQNCERLLNLSNTVVRLTNENEQLKERIVELEIKGREKTAAGKVEVIDKLETRIEELEKKVKEVHTSEVVMLDEREYPALGTEGGTSGIKTRAATGIWSNANRQNLMRINNKLTSEQKVVQKEQFGAVNVLTAELNEREKRKKNVIVYNLEVSKKEKKEDRQAEDMLKVKEMVGKLNEFYKRENEKAIVKKVTRLQSKPEAKNVPIIIVELETEGPRNELLYIVVFLIL